MRGNCFQTNHNRYSTSIRILFENIAVKSIKYKLYNKEVS